MKKTEAYFMSHCDNETCDLGVFQYTCTHCSKVVNDYEVWWKQDDIWGIQRILNAKDVENS